LGGLLDGLVVRGYVQAQDAAGQAGDDGRIIIGRRR
jgi:hypothetical protein